MEIKSLYPSASEHKVNFLLNSGLSFPVSVDDYTGTQAGWQLRASMTGFSVPNAPAATDLTGGLYFSNPDVTGEIPETLATGNALTTIRTGANGHEYGPQVPILSAAPGKGMGHNTADFALPDVRLLLAFNVLARPQRYSATILWTLADTPTAVGV
ncbi:hypothetical protein FC34_GL001302 [Lacticaseibacillus brantae DSM 23927]|uniref:WxL domain-containing protein n=2 Tax=Lacticaseibacillus brantae TaxID=943673 RepID=A0A0R2AWK4_9LACO|nr:hypothetical protein FC34_GL001302 [Lacticaseibacillus brantae DSM 23927]